MGEEGSEVRLVRCPKCKNLLEEYPHLSVYQCGGCGAVLQAKKKAPVSEGLMEKTEGERGEMGSESMGSILVKEGISVGNVSETKRESEGFDSDWNKEIEIEEKIDVDSSFRIGKRDDLGVTKESFREETMDRRIVDSSLRVEKGEDMSVKKNGRFGEETMGGRVERTSVNEDFDFAVKDVRSSKHKHKQPIISSVEADDNGVISEEMGKMKPQNGRAGRLPRFVRELDVEKVGYEGIRGDFRATEKQGRFRAFAYPDEGPSHYHPGHAYGYGMKLMHSDTDESNIVENLEKDRAELLRKLEALKDQLSRSCDLADNSREKVPICEHLPPSDAYGGHQRVPFQSFTPDKEVLWPPYFNHSHGHVPSVNSYERDVQNLYLPPRLPRYASNNVSEDQFLPHMFRRSSHTLPWHYTQQPFQDYYYSRPPSYPHGTTFHEPLCTGVHCPCQNWQKPSQIPSSVPGYRRFPNDPTNPNFYHPVNLATYESQNYNTRSANPHSHFQGPPWPHVRQLNDCELESDAINQHMLNRPVAVHEKRQHCHPIADGAPFITCCNCLELLKLPKKLNKMEKDHQKVRCGSCSSVNVLEVYNKRLVVSILSRTKQEPVEIDDGSGEVLNEIGLTSYGFLASSITRQGPSYQSSVDFGDEESPDSVLVQEKIVNSHELPLGDSASPTLSESPLMDSDHAANRFGMGNNGKDMDQGEGVVNISASLQNSLKDSSLTSEMEVSYNDDRNKYKDSVEVLKKERKPKSHGNESFFASLFKMNLKDFSKSNRRGGDKRAMVLVNGQSIPDRDVKKAEKVAGQICPGEYWYDFRAGFWGVMGQPCLGIIPPHIQEFNYPMPKSCGAGDTGVYVNGRELHGQDLDMLANRGLPTTRNKSYIIEISGRVLDEGSGEELDCLGKLAPTVEKLNHGFGMRVPEATVG